jgi:site-specific recombinase XerD
VVALSTALPCTASPKEATVEETLNRMRQDLARKGYARTTQEGYRKTAERFLRGVGPREPDREDLRRFVQELEAQGKSASWMKMQLSGLVFLFRKTLGRPNEVSFISFPRQRSPLPTVLSQEEVERLFAAIEVRRYRAVAVVLYGTGLRISEALALRIDDIDGGRGVMHVRKGKGGKARTVRLTPSLLEWLRQYWARDRPPAPFLFSSRRTGKPPTKQTVREALAQAGQEAGIKKRVTPHVLRHCYATHLLEAGVDVHVLQTLLGHSQVQTTARYARVSTKIIEKTPSPVDLLPSFSPR